VARRSARRRQGHHAVSLRDLAGDAAGGGTRSAAPGVGARLRAVGRRQDEQDRRHRGEPGRRDRAPWRRRAAILPAARSRIRERRQLQLGPVRRALRRRSRGHLRQPRVARALHGAALP
jgi:hypothetical protein